MWDIVQEHFVQCILCAMPQAGPAVALVAEHRLQRQDFAGLGVLKQAATDRQRLNWTAFQSDQ